MRWVIVAVLALAWPQASNASLSPFELQVVPGKSVGYVKMGMTTQQMLVTFGMPDDVDREPAPGGGTNIYWTYDLNTGGVLVVSWTRPSPGVDFIYTDSPVAHMRTDHRHFAPALSVIKVGDTLFGVVGMLGPPKAIGGATRPILQWDGVRIRFDGGRVSAFFVIP
jgi:hypothetical protein